MIRANSTSSELNVLRSQYYCLLNNPRSLLSRQMVGLHFLTFFLLKVIMAANLVDKWNANHSDLVDIKFCQLQVGGLRASMWLPTSSLLCYMILENLHIDGKPQSASVTTMRTILTNGCIHTHTHAHTHSGHRESVIYKLDHVYLLALFSCLLPHHSLV